MLCCRAKGKVFNIDTLKVLLMTGYETHPENQLTLNRFKNICNQRAQAEQISLQVIYNEVSFIFVIITNTNYYIARKLIGKYYYTNFF